MDLTDYLFYPTSKETYRDQIPTTKIPAQWSNGLCPKISSTELITSWDGPLTVNEAKKILP